MSMRGYGIMIAAFFTVSIAYSVRYCYGMLELLKMSKQPESPLSLPESFPLRQLLGDRRLWLVGVSYACIGFTVLVPFTFLGVYATKELQLAYGTATRFFAVLACCCRSGARRLRFGKDKGRRPVGISAYQTGSLDKSSGTE